MLFNGEATPQNCIKSHDLKGFFSGREQLIPYRFVTSGEREPLPPHAQPLVAFSYSAPFIVYPICYNWRRPCLDYGKLASIEMQIRCKLPTNSG